MICAQTPDMQALETTIGTLALPKYSLIFFAATPSSTLSAEIFSRRLSSSETFPLVVEMKNCASKRMRLSQHRRWRVKPTVCKSFRSRCGLWYRPKAKRHCPRRLLQTARRKRFRHLPSVGIKPRHRFAGFNSQIILLRGNTQRRIDIIGNLDYHSTFHFFFQSS